MILADIKQYLSQRGSASLSDISTHFDTDPEALRGMLEQWIRKGRVRKHLVGASCGGSCNKCGAENSEVYQWIDTTVGTFKGIEIIQDRKDG